MYETVINDQLPSADYALYQKAVIAGANSQYARKVLLYFNPYKTVIRLTAGFRCKYGSGKYLFGK